VTVVVYTIGHSTRSIEEFVALLQREDIRAVADVRAFPTSRRYPHFNRDSLASTLAGKTIAYRHAPALGGRRRPRPDSANAGWRNEGFRAYADHMTTPEFREAIGDLIASAVERRTTVMCAEAVPWRCHRSLIADALVARGCEVRHVLDASTNPHTLTDFAQVVDGEVTYPQRDVSAIPQTELFGSG
jgi:uncharacterized protein (DUF488 family)